MNKFWIIWNPAYPEPPKKRYETKDEARTVAVRMAQQFPGEQFFVLEALLMAEIPTGPIVQALLKGPAYR